MKKLFIISAIVGIVALTANQSNAQVSINLNIGTQPAWVPAGYQSVDYYYLPEVQSYYCVPQRRFVYLSGSRWIRSRYLPARYRGYDLHHGRKIVMYGNNPYRNFNEHRVTYISRNNYYRSSYGGGDRIRYNSPRYDYRPHREKNWHREGRGDFMLRGHGHGGGKHGRH
ncbi:MULTISPECIES: hypothetical protein [Pedobacter]|uniref:YXWGXW repeat-containing protein n=1 Tax=Pedobacter zeae TaxID=1737356 RepID=A0A7W6K890_9SPHI|nr:hypothetical protein [Pedobacter zeae]MBB4107038.1 hypothetical protein [Pedobacter zeae]GGH05346.1 hypothetical protein GCM10007422_21390 [Pedobacter zeae]